MISRRLLLGTAAAAAMTCVGSADCRRPDRNSVVACHGRPARRNAECAGRGLQQVPEGLQGRPRLQRHLHRDHDRRDCSIPRQAAAPYRSGIRGRHGDHDGGQRRDLSRASADGRTPGEKFDPGAYLPAVYGYYSTTDGKLLSMPFNSSTPVLYYNKDAFKKAGLADNRHRKPGRKSRITRSGSWPPATSAASPPSGRPGCRSRISARGTTFRLRQGRTGSPGRTSSSRSTIRCGSVTSRTSRKWHKDKIFVYAGREGKPNPKFTTGECPMIMASAGSAGGFARP